MSVVFPLTPDPRFRLSTATAAQTSFSVPFPFQDNADISVLRIDLAGVEHALSESADYTLTGAGNPSGGSIELVVPATVGEQYVRYGLAVLERVTSIVRGGRYSSIGTDDDLDRSIIIAQELRRDIARAMLRRFDDASTSFELPLPVTGFFLSFASDGSFIARAGDALSGNIVIATGDTVMVGPLDGVIILNRAAPKSTTTIDLPLVSARVGALPLRIVDWSGNAGDVAVIAAGSDTVMGLSQAVLTSNGQGLGLAAAQTIFPLTALNGWFPA